MRRRLWFTVVSLTVGLGMLLAASFASAASSPQGAAKKAATGGTLRIDSRSDFDYIDPSLAYFSHSWQMLETVCENLYRYPDSEGNAGVRPIPGTAQGFPKFSNGGKQVDITVRKNYARFQNGEWVTAKSYANAMQRNLDPTMQSPAGSNYQNEIVGANAVLDGKGKSASGIQVKGNHLILKFTKPVPDIVNRLTMAFFCPQPGASGLPRNKDGIGAPFSGAGPYYISAWTPSRSAVLERNPNWKGAIAKTRTANVDRMEYTFGLTQAATKLRLDKNETDLGAIPTTEVANVAQQYGINKGRFFLRKQMTMWYLAMNHEQPLFGPKGSPNGNVPLLKALNTAIDRPALVRQFGYLAGARTDQIIPYTMPGFRNWDIYSIRGANPTKAAALAKGNTRSGKAVFYTFNSTPGPAIAQVVQQNMKAIGVDIEIKTFDRVVQNQKEATRGEPFDITFEGWGADYADPITFFNTLLWGGSIQQANNSNISYFNSPTYNSRIIKTAGVAGAARFTSYANLDRDIMKNASPFAPFINTNARIYVGPDVGCYKYAPAHGVTNLAAVCKK
jgi:ABC-type oligopeptide transport system substrate-binding subunit